MDKIKAIGIVKKMLANERISKAVRDLQTQSLTTRCLVGFAGLFMIVIACGYLFEWQWTGLPAPDPKDPRPTGKTLWDWLDLLIIPIVLTGFALWFRRFEAEIARQTEHDRAQEAALETYFDRMSELLLDKENPLLHTEPKSPQQEMAATRTITALRRLDRQRRNQVFSFLTDARLFDLDESLDKQDVKPYFKYDPANLDISISILAGRNLNNLDIQGAELDYNDLRDCRFLHSNLSQASLEGTNLNNSVLIETKLSEVHMSGVRLRNAIIIDVDLSKLNLVVAEMYKCTMNQCNVSYANLVDADLSEATLRKVNLDGAILRLANLYGANFKSVSLVGADLKAADLRKTTGLTCEVLTTALNWEEAYRDETLRCGSKKPIPIKKEDETEENENASLSQ